MAPRSLHLRVLWTEVPPQEQAGAAEPLAAHGLSAGQTLFGMQRGRWEVVPGARQPDGTTLFETDVEPYLDKAGRQRFRGEMVQGPPHEPFIYLSWRPAKQRTWIMRAKVLLAPLTPKRLASLADGVSLQTTVSQMGHRPAGHVQEWMVV